MQRWQRREFEEALARGVGLNVFSRAFADYLRKHGASYGSVIDFVELAANVRRGSVVDAPAEEKY